MRRAILGAALASTDPVLLRTLIRHPNLPPSARVALKLESGMNDVVLLPIVVLSMLALRPEGAAPAWEVGSHAVGLFLLGPLSGVVAGYVAITLLDWIRKRVGVRRDYESLYALGVAFTAYAAAEAVGGSGFLAGFAAGLVIAALDVELCDCFLDYGEASAEMFLLLTFVAFGASLIWSGFTIVDGPVLLFAVVALLVRTAMLMPVLELADLDPGACRIIAWMGPRGLSSLLLVLLPVFAGISGSERLFQVTCLVVLLSVVLHGGGIALFLRRAAGSGWRRQSPSRQRAHGRGLRALPPRALRSRRRSGSPSKSWAGSGTEGKPVVVIDVRTERSYRDDDLIAKGALRFPPDDAVRLARERRLPVTPLWCSTVRERTKPQAPGWCESFEGQDGPTRGRWWAAGRCGRPRGCRWSRRKESLVVIEGIEPLW